MVTRLLLGTGVVLCCPLSCFVESGACLMEQRAHLREARGAETEPGEAAKGAGRVWICSLHPSLL